MLNVRGCLDNSERIFPRCFEMSRFFARRDLHGNRLTSGPIFGTSQLPHLQRLIQCGSKVTDQWQFLADLSVLNRFSHGG